MRSCVLVLIVAACSTPSEPSSDASYFGPPPEAGPTANCVAGFYGGDPMTQCFARWDCAVEGMVTLICGTDIGTQGPQCACHREGVDPIVVGLPSSCTDITVLTEFARQACGWSFL